MINTKYKDRLFSFIFGNAERKEWTLSLYNAVNGSSYTNPEDIELMTMEDVLYINYGKNKELMEACRPLADYAWFVEEIRRYNKTMSIETAVDKALDNMSENSMLKKFLIANKAEVKQMCITEYNEAETMEQFRNEGREEGREEGELLHLIKTIYKKMLKGKANNAIADEVEEDIIMIERIKQAIIEYRKDCKNEEFDADQVLLIYYRNHQRG